MKYEANPADNTSHHSPGPPVLKVVRTTEIGMEIETDQPLEVGHELEIGFQMFDDSHDASFIVSADSLVVESERVLSDRGEFCHLVTLLFCGVEHRDRMRLMQLSHSQGSKVWSRRTTMGYN